MKKIVCDECGGEIEPGDEGGIEMKIRGSPKALLWNFTIVACKEGTQDKDCEGDICRNCIRTMLMALWG